MGSMSGFFYMKFQIKRLYTFMLQRFIPLFFMTFFIVLFIVLMQFLWKLVDELVGKGLQASVVMELFFYAALTMVPTALPLAVLLASLMTFGNLGEKFELTAMKASGISLFKIMKPLIVLMIFIAGGAFFFQNNVLPVAQAKMWTLLFSVRQKSPEVEIPERSFYDQIPNMNLYVDHKNPETGVLYNMIIYDLTGGIDNSRVILADSGKLAFTEDKNNLYLHLYQGEMFENLRSSSMGIPTSGYMPFRSEKFTDKEIYFPFDMNFNKLDEQNMRNQYVGKNISQLRVAIDSIGAEVDSLGAIYANDLRGAAHFGVPFYKTEHKPDTVITELWPEARVTPSNNIDTIWSHKTPDFRKLYLMQAIEQVNRNKQEFEFKTVQLSEQAKIMRRNDIELQKKFTLSIACILFFFIGAPLGAIIKKGGIGVPLVVSVLLFIVYYIFDNTGYKMARDGKLEVWEGIWLSTAVLLPMGIFFTYKAVGDSGVFNLDAYKAFIRRVTGREPKRTLFIKELIMEEVEPQIALEKLEKFDASLDAAMKRTSRMWKLHKIARRIFPSKTAEALNEEMNEVVDYLSNSRSLNVISLLGKYPFVISPTNVDKVKEVTQMLIVAFKPQPEGNVESEEATVENTETK